MNNLGDPIDDPSNYKWGLFYYNPDDDRVIVPKRARLLGYTFNCARPETYYIMIILVLVVYVCTRLKSV